MPIEPENAAHIGRDTKMRLAAKQSRQRSCPGAGMTSNELRVQRCARGPTVYTGRCRRCQQTLRGLTE